MRLWNAPESAWRRFIHAWPGPAWLFDLDSLAIKMINEPALRWLKWPRRRVRELSLERLRSAAQKRT
ncbi:MAG: hypothetical protein HY549_11010 [Elusimicrobia bacterium]|nr:hypothetical protein [Elusimicrobiota bacterium]